MKSHYPISTLRRCGGLIGWGRGELGRPAGVRTTLLVCPAAVPGTIRGRPTRVVRSVAGLLNRRSSCMTEAAIIIG